MAPDRGARGPASRPQSAVALGSLPARGQLIAEEDFSSARDNSAHYRDDLSGRDDLFFFCLFFFSDRSPCANFTLLPVSSYHHPIDSF